jgi:hypothetical protein
LFLVHRVNLWNFLVEHFSTFWQGDLYHDGHFPTISGHTFGTGDA